MDALALEANEEAIRSGIICMKNTNAGIQQRRLLLRRCLCQHRCLQSLASDLHRDREPSRAKETQGAHDVDNNERRDDNTNPHKNHRCFAHAHAHATQGQQIIPEAHTAAKDKPDHGHIQTTARSEASELPCHQEDVAAVPPVHRRCPHGLGYSFAAAGKLAFGIWMVDHFRTHALNVGNVASGAGKRYMQLWVNQSSFAESSLDCSSAHVFQRNCQYSLRAIGQDCAKY